MLPRIPRWPVAEFNIRCPYSTGASRCILDQILVLLIFAASKALVSAVPLPFAISKLHHPIISSENEPLEAGLPVTAYSSR